MSSWEKIETAWVESVVRDRIEYQRDLIGDEEEMRIADKLMNKIVENIRNDDDLFNYINDEVTNHIYETVRNEQKKNN